MLTEEEQRRWLWLRAAEWTNLPTFVSQPIVPILFIFYPWYAVLAGVFALAVLWSLVRYTYVSVQAATTAALFVIYCKWPAAIGSAIYLLWRHSYVAAVIAAAWPLVCGIVVVPGKIGRVELMFMRKMGLIDPNVE